MYLEPQGAARDTFNDWPLDKAEALARKMPGHAATSFVGTLTSTSHYDIPITYVLCTMDKIIPPSRQRQMIDDVKQVSRSTVDVVELESGHCPHVTHPDEAVKVVIEAAGGS